GEISFYQHLAKRFESIEKYGIKFISVNDTYKGAGLYHIVVEAGLKLPMDKDGRVTANNTDYPIYKEEFYIAYMDVEEELDELNENGEKKKEIVKRYKRVSKDTFEEMLNQLIELQLQPSVSDMLLHYRKFFEKVFLKSATFHSQIQGIASLDKTKTFLEYANIIYNGTEEMKDVYDFHFAVGTIDEISHNKIKEQITIVQKHVKELKKLLDYENYSHLFELTLDRHPMDNDILRKYNETKHYVGEMVSDKYWFDTTTGKFFPNPLSLYWEYIPTKQFYSREIREMQQQVTALVNILETYVDRKGEIPEDGILFVELHKETKMETLIDTYNKKFDELKRHYERQTFEEWEQFTYLFEEKPLESGEESE
ncbi:hypothetical protein, partial [Bacillus cereus group sp. BfR-BA-01516]